MPRFTLRTLGRLELVGPDGPCRVDDPIGLPLMVLAALAPGGGVDDEAAARRLVPDLPPVDARARLAAALAAVTAGAGAPVAEHAHGRLTLRRDLVAADVETAAVAETNPLQAGFLAGLTPPSPGFAEWVAEVRPRIRAAQPASRPRSWLGTPNDRTAALIALGGVILLLAVWATRAVAPAGLAPGDPIVVAEFENATGDTLLDHSLAVAAALSLRQSGRFVWNRVPASLDRAREAARHSNARFVLGFRIERAGDGFRLSSVLADVRSGTPVRTAATTAGDRARILSALDRLVEETRTGLGERRDERSGRSRRIEDLATPSLEALRAFALGCTAWSAGEPGLAEEQWARARRLDSRFGLAAKGAIGCQD